VQYIRVEFELLLYKTQLELFDVLELLLLRLNSKNYCSEFLKILRLYTYFENYCILAYPTHNRKLWLRQQCRSFPTTKTRAVGEETLSQQENSAVGKEIFANSSKSKD
jgi:hypothetical protein